MMLRPVPQNNYLAGHEALPPGSEMLHADETFLVLSKPSGLLSVPGRGDDKQDCLSRRVQLCFPDALVVHRLDMATSGLMLMARGIEAQRALGELFAQRRIQKTYVAVVHGQMRPAVSANAWQLIDLPIAADWARRPLRMIDIAGKPSQTPWRVLGHDLQAGTTRVELQPVTGRSHQLRVHLQALGHPIMGDALYAGELAGDAPRLMLHATQLSFSHPASGAPVQFESKPLF